MEDAEIMILRGTGNGELVEGRGRDDEARGEGPMRYVEKWGRMTGAGSVDSLSREGDGSVEGRENIELNGVRIDTSKDGESRGDEVREEGSSVVISGGRAEVKLKGGKAKGKGSMEMRGSSGESVEAEVRGRLAKRG